MKRESDSKWVVLGVPSAAGNIFEIVRNVLLAGLAVSVVVMWTHRGPLAHPWFFAIILGLFASGPGVWGLVWRWRFRRDVTELQSAVSPILASLRLGPPTAICSPHGVRLAWVVDERAFEMLVMPRKREACLHLVEAPPGFVLSENTVDAWCEFPRPDLVLGSERERGLAFSERVVWKELGSVALRGATPALAVKRVLELVTDQRQ